MNLQTVTLAVTGLGRHEATCSALPCPTAATQVSVFLQARQDTSTPPQVTTFRDILCTTVPDPSLSYTQLHAHGETMAMMASGTAGNFYDDDNAVLDDDFLNDGLSVIARE